VDPGGPEALTRTRLRRVLRAALWGLGAQEEGAGAAWPLEGPGAEVAWEEVQVGDSSLKAACFAAVGVEVVAEVAAEGGWDAKP
jgi:hypothetical protein